MFGFSLLKYTTNYSQKELLALPREQFVLSEEHSFFHIGVREADLVLEPLELSQETLTA